jgi:nucleoside-diphosphate-sugar epimerase
MLKCGITGHTGVLGKEIIKFFNFNFIKFQGDIANIKDTENWIKKNKFDLIIHLAAIVPTKKVKLDYKNAISVNYLGTKNLVKSINKHKIKLKWFFFSSTSHVYQACSGFKLINEKSKKIPYTEYGKTKLYAEKYIKKYLNKKYKKCIGRIFSFTGAKQTKDYFLPSVNSKINNSNKKKIYFYNSNHYRDFIDTYDICSAIKKLWSKRANGTFNIGTGIATNLKDIIIYICKRRDKIPIFIENEKKSSYIIADIKKIKNLNWLPKKNLISILNKYLKSINLPNG